MPDPATYAVIVCARANSERLPGKALAELAPGVTVLGQTLQRWANSDRAPRIVFATPAEPCNDGLARAACSLGVPVSRQPPGNAVAEMDAAVRCFAPDAKYVARALADNPLVDVALADWRLDILDETGADGLWYGGDHERITYAGTTDVWSRAAWDRIAAESSGSQLAHPGALYWDKLGSFNAVQIPLPRREYLAPYRTELDTAQDLEVMRAVWKGWVNYLARIEGWTNNPPPPETLWALRWLAAHPAVAALNGSVQAKTMTRALFGVREKPWLCETCRGRVGSVREGNLVIHCQGCGQVKKWFSVKPRGRVEMGWVP